MSGDIEAAARKIFEQLPDIDGDEADWLFYREALCAGARDAIAALVAERDALRKALERAQVLVGLVTVRQAIHAGDEAIEAAGLNPYAMNEGQATGDEHVSTWWLRAALSPEHQREEG
jgi:hypothetical protein